MKIVNVAPSQKRELKQTNNQTMVNRTGRMKNEVEKHDNKDDEEACC